MDIVDSSVITANPRRKHGGQSNLTGPSLDCDGFHWSLAASIFGLLADLTPGICYLSSSGEFEAEARDSEPGSGTFKAHLVQSFSELRKSANVFGSPSMILILLITMLQLSLVLCTFQFLSQFCSKRYNIPLADTGYIQSAYGVAFITVSFFIMPFVSSAILKPSAPAILRFDNDRQRDLFLARSSYLASLVGTFILGLSGSLPGFVFGLAILAFGVSGEGFLKSVATLYVTSEQRSRLFTILGLSAIASDLWVSPTLAALFSLGMRLGGVWIGLPYFGVSSLCVLMFSMSLFLKLPTSSIADEESDSDENLNSE